MPRDASLAVRELEARSIGTSRMMLVGRASEKKMGTSRYAGVVRRGRKWRRRSSTSREMATRASRAKMSEPREDDAMLRSGCRQHGVES
jgi:hypothetical protein